MKQFNLLKEVHGIRARLMGLDYQSERKFNKNNIYAVFLLIVAGFILYEVYPILEFGHPPSPSIPVMEKAKNDETAFMPMIDEATTPHSEEIKDNSKDSPHLITPPPVKKEKTEVRHGVYNIRVAICVLKESADVVQRDLRGKGFSSYQKIGPGYIKGKITNLHRVYVGDYNNKKDVLLVVDKLKANGFSAIVEETPTLPSPTGGEGKRKGGN